jgi:hypothetical protein
MGFLLFPLAAVMLFAGLVAQIAQLSSTLPGQGRAGMLEINARIAAQQAEMFGAACIDSAQRSGGVVSSNLPVVLPPGVMLPVGAVCATETAAVGVRNVYAWMPAGPGAAGQLISDTDANAAWARVTRAGWATNLVTGQLQPVPAVAPIGALVATVQATP